METMAYGYPGIQRQSKETSNMRASLKHFAERSLTQEYILYNSTGSSKPGESNVY